MKRCAVLVLFLSVVLAPAAKLAAQGSESRFKVAEVRHFTLAEGVKLPDTINPPHFLSLLPDEVRTRLKSSRVAAETVGEDGAVAPAAAAESIVVESTITHTKLGFRNFSNPAKLTMEIKIFRRSDHALLASTAPTLKMLGGWYSDDEHFAKMIGQWETEEIEKALKNVGR